MLVREYLASSGMNAVELSNLLGHKTTSSITKKMDEEMPKRWVRLLDSEPTPAAVEDGNESEARTHEFEPTEESQFREQSPPFDPDSDPIVGPQKIKLTTVEGYINQIYGGAAYIARNRGDELAADVIDRYKPDFAEAWIEYIKSDPRLLEYLEKLMIGTPLGNLIGVHVIAIGSYAFARAAAAQIATAYADDREAEPSNVNGTGNATPTHPLA